MKRQSVQMVCVVLLLISLLVSVGGTALARPAGEDRPAPMVTMTANGVIRAWPDSSADSLGTIPNRVMVPVTGRTVDFTWWQIPYPDGPGGFGWLAATVVLPGGTAAGVPVIQVIIPTPAAAPTPVVPTPAPAPESCTLNAAFVADVTVPDGAQFGPGQAINKVWRLRNSGTCSWDGTSVLKFVGGFQMSAPGTVPLPQTPPGGTADVAVTAYSPVQDGSYRSVWQPVYQPTSMAFGSKVTLVIGVVGGSPAPQPPKPPKPQPPQPPPPPKPPKPQPVKIDYWADHTSLKDGKCTNIHWNVQHASKVEFNDGKWKGVVGQDTHKACPHFTKTYKLRVVDQNGKTHNRDITIDVQFKPAPNPHPHDPMPGPVPNPNPDDDFGM